MQAVRLPPPVMAGVTAALAAAGDATPVRSLAPVKGGMESHACKLTTRKGPYFLKWSDTVAPGRYATEARGLALLRESGAVRAPIVLAYQDRQAGQAGGAAAAPAFFLAEWLERPPGEVFIRRTGGRLGAQIAAMHRRDVFWGTPIPGYRDDDGALDSGGFQADGWDADWATHFRERVLRPRIDRAISQQRLRPEQVSRLERLLSRLDSLLGGIERRPSLLHGDLHRGNVLCDRAGAPALVDPHPVFGDREMELAYTEVTWSRFPPAFYSAYFEAWPAAPAREERRDLYMLAFNLDWLLREPQRAMAVDAIAARYGGAR